MFLSVSALISLLRFLLAHESVLLPQYNIFLLASQVYLAHTEFSWMKRRIPNKNSVFSYYRLFLWFCIMTTMQIIRNIVNFFVWFCNHCSFYSISPFFDLQVVNIFNLFITFGDTFLPSPSAYDELYYEVVRMHQVFDNLYSMGELFYLLLFNPELSDT